MKQLFLSLALLHVLAFFAVTKGHAQKLYTKNGEISFFSKAPLENIVALNKTVAAVLDVKTGEVQVAVLMRGFEFEKSLMQEHFNENYVESDKYPKAIFSGTIQGNDATSYTKDNTYPATVKGKLTLHGIQKEIQIEGSIITTMGVPRLSTEFNVLLSDYKITIPSMVANKISESVLVKVSCTLDKLLK